MKELIELKFQSKNKTNTKKNKIIIQRNWSISIKLRRVILLQIILIKNRLAKTEL